MLPGKKIMASPDMAAAAPEARQRQTATMHLAYWLAAGVQVRREKFGLLFYDYRGPRLYFLPTGDLISDAFFSSGQTVDQLARAIQQQHGLPRRQVEDYLQQVLDKLSAKGLINGQPLC
jgi:putative mycofactocin binding protein MftB